MAKPILANQDNVVRHTITASSAQQTLLEQGGKAGGTVGFRICSTATAACYIATGSNPTATTSSMTIPAGLVEIQQFRIPKDGSLKVAIIGTASSGVIEFTQVDDGI